MCNVTFPSSVNTTGTANAGISTRSEAELYAVAEKEAVHLGARQAAASTIVVPPTILCSNQCSTTKAGCIAATYDSVNALCYFITSLGTSAIGSGISDTVVMAGKRVVAADGSTSTSLAAPGPTAVSSRSASAYVYPTTTTTTTTPAVSLPAILPTATTTDCGLLGLNCGPTKSSLTTQNCVLGLNILGGLLCDGPTRTMQTVTTATTSYTKTTTVIPVTTVYTTSTVSYCNVGPGGFTSCSSSRGAVVTVTPIPATSSTKACVTVLGIVTC